MRHGRNRSISARLRELRIGADNMAEAIADMFGSDSIAELGMPERGEMVHLIDELDTFVMGVANDVRAIERELQNRPASMQTPSASGRRKKPRTRSAYQNWAAKERKLIARQHPRFDFARTQTELSKRWKREKKKRGKK
jgi:hypothetical protein